MSVGYATCTLSLCMNFSFCTKEKVLFQTKVQLLCTFLFVYPNTSFPISFVRNFEVFFTFFIFTLLPLSYKKTSLDQYESRAQGRMCSLRSSQVSTHVGLEEGRCSPRTLRRSRSRLSQISRSSSQTSRTDRAHAEPDRHSLLEHDQCAQEFTV